MKHSERWKKAAALVFMACATLALAFSVSAQTTESDGAAVPVELDKVRVDSKRASEGSAAAGYRHAESNLGPLGRQSLQDTPYSINVTSGELIERRAAHTVSDALKTNPTVFTLMESAGYSSMSRVMIRGLTAADQNDQRDGLIDRSFSFVPLENVERIEVLNGLSSFLYGFASLGGALNYVSKQPTDTPLLTAAFGTYAGGLANAHVDAGGHAGEGGRIGYRVNLYREDGSTYLDGSDQRRDLVSGYFTYQLSEQVALWADAWHQELDMQGLQSYINVNPSRGIHVPSADLFDARTQYGQDWTYNRANKTLLGVGLTTQLADHASMRLAYRYGDMWRDYRYVALTLSDNAGNYASKAVGTPRQTEQTHSAYALFDTDFRTGPLAHTVTAGYTTTSFSYSRGDDVSASLTTSNIAAPTVSALPTLAVAGSSTWSNSAYRNWVFGDHIAWGPQWAALLGLNRAELVQHRWGSATALSNQDFAQFKVSPSYALTYKPSSGLTAYGSYMEGLVNGGTAPSTATNANATLAPSVSQQYELGMKSVIDRVDLTAAVFWIDKINEYTDPADNVYKQEGREIHRGLELTATGRVGTQWTLVGGLTIQQAYIDRAANTPALEGKTPVNVPRQQARVYAEYEVPGVNGLSFSGAANFSGRRPVDSANLDYMAGVTTYDTGLRYASRWQGRQWSVTMNVANLFDKAYWSYYRSGDGLWLGAPRTVSLVFKTAL